MPESTSHSFHLSFNSLVNNKLEIPFWKKSGIERIVSSDFTVIWIGCIDQMNMRLSRVLCHLQCSNISPKKPILLLYLR